MTERNASICRYYQDGHSLKECASHFTLGRQRIKLILQAGNVWRPYVKGERTQFLGVNVSEETKGALKEKADAAGKSVSRFASDALDEVVAK